MSENQEGYAIPEAVEIEPGGDGGLEGVHGGRGGRSRVFLRNSLHHRLETIPGVGVARSRVFGQILRNRNRSWNRFLRNRPNYRVGSIPLKESPGVGSLRFQLQEPPRSRNRILRNRLKPT